MAGGLAVLPHHEAAHLHCPRLEIVRIDAVVPNEGIGHRDDLSGVGGVCEHLLVAGHAGVEHNFSRDVPARAEGLAFKGRAVGED